MSTPDQAGVASSLPLSFTVDQGRLLMSALAELPFKRVFELIGKLNASAQAPAGVATGLRASFTTAELALALEALGQLPYVQVHALIDELQAQVHQAGAPAQAGKGRRIRSHTP
ncbi:hypothetical protein ACTOWA_25280 [Herbaspirillum seropedicae]|uniref:hypothetical protein n=1 Tax=Herbaspirillum seropedicae TaxID=964 RepID=UPI003F8D4596